MQFFNEHGICRDDIICLFKETFTASEGEAEGDLVANLVTGMFDSVAPHDIHVFTAFDEGKLVGAVIFTRMNFVEDDRTVFILSPAAVATARQGEGIGQALLSHGIGNLRKIGADVVLTYGDPCFYSKVGFGKITGKLARAPLPLSHPEGWLGQSLTTETLTPLKGASTCVAPLDNQLLW
ncbi:GNAT family N-acetyltransferase [Paracoccus indicus]|uniref:GNAT family N-acetyltransferase n=1 Tax=Paracoccus indicus TaxID=2079229 RepID=UPI000D3ACBCE|nr:N-acetyltransferase [Paracoccus indicus]